MAASSRDEIYEEKYSFYTSGPQKKLRNLKNLEV
jgi:hypothetical protein